MKDFFSVLDGFYLRNIKALALLLPQDLIKMYQLTSTIEKVHMLLQVLQLPKANSNPSQSEMHTKSKFLFPIKINELYLFIFLFNKNKYYKKEYSYVSILHDYTQNSYKLNRILWIYSISYSRFHSDQFH